MNVGGTATISRGRKVAVPEQFLRVKKRGGISGKEKKEERDALEKKGATDTFGTGHTAKR